MYLIFQLRLLRALEDKGFDALQFLGASRFETARIVENKAWVASEYHLVVDIMFPALYGLEIMDWK